MFFKNQGDGRPFCAFENAPKELRGYFTAKWRAERATEPSRPLGRDLTNPASSLGRGFYPFRSLQSSSI